MRVGLIGTGNMGNRIGPGVLGAGHQLVVYDLRRESARALCDRGAQWVEGPRQVAREAEVVLTSLPGPTVVEQVVFDPDQGLLGALAPGAVYADMTTSTPWLAERIYEACRERDVRALDSPLSKGGEFVTVGGDRDAFEQCRPVLEAVSEHVLYMGGPGLGQVAKLAHQYVTFCNMMTLMEALLFSVKGGLDVTAVADFLKASVGRSSHGDRVLGSLLAREFGGPGVSKGTLDIVSKDISLAVELARRLGTPTQVGLVVGDMLQRGQAQGWGRHEHWAAVQLLEQSAGIELRVDPQR